MSLITFTSSFGSGGEMIAQKVAKELDIDFFDDHRLHERVLSMGISSADLEGLDERAPRLFDRLFTNKPAIYLDVLGSVVYDIASQGEGVLVGHGAQVFLEDFHCALHVMIHASAEARNKWIRKDQNLGEDAALQLVHKMDKRLHDFVRYAFERDWQDSSGYDIVINLEKVGVDWATKLIIDLARSDEIKECSMKAIEEMELSSLKRKVDAAVIKSHLSSTYTGINVDVIGGGNIYLRGWISDKNDLDRLISVIKEVPGVSEVKSEAVIMAPSGFWGA